MKKLIAIMMVLFMTFALAGTNDFRTDLGSSFTPATADRFHFLDESGLGSTEHGQSYVTYGWLTSQMGALFGSIVSIDTVLVLAEASGSGTYSIAIESDEILLLDWLWVETGGHSTDYYALATADSNGTDLDTLNLIETGRRTNTYFFQPTQDTTLYIVRGDTMSVNPVVAIRQMVFEK